MGSRDNSGGTFITIVLVVLLLICAWMSVRAAALTVRVGRSQPKNIPFWLAVLATLLFSGLALANFGQSAALNLSAIVSTLAMLMIAKVSETHHDPLLQEEFNNDALIQAVLHDPWWDVEPMYGS